MTTTPKKDYNKSDNRIINYLRISVTDRCNLACRYCVPKEILPELPHNKIARYEEIHKIVVCASELGIKKLRITGGEPFMRKGLLPFIKSLSQIDGINDISITTNGVLLEPNIDALIESGVNRINVSLDTLKSEKFKFISGRDKFHAVWRGIMAALDNKRLSPIKLNAVILRGINDDEIEALAGLSLRYPFHVRFIEYMPMGNSAVDISEQVLIPEIREQIERGFGTLEPVITNQNNTVSQLNRKNDKINSHEIQNNEAGPAKRYKIKGALGEIGFISPVSSHFCHQCNRLRLTSTGHLRPCLLNNLEIDLITQMRQGASDETIKDMIITAIKSKPASHNLNISRAINTTNNTNSSYQTNQLAECNRVDTQMSTIGG
ncbi:MAG: radical SAM protein [Desulfamplus sp.]|nr:radical SAM protein [Desulfamplus sp.]